MSAIIVDKSIVPIIKRNVDIEKERLRLQIEADEEELQRFESDHTMSSEDFVLQYRGGELGDDEKWIRWEFVYETHKVLREKFLLLEQIRYES